MTANPDLFARIITILEAERIPYTLTEHEPVYTSQQAAAVRGTELKTGAKALLVTADRQIYLVVLSAADKLRYKKLRKLLGVRDIKMLPRDEAERITGLAMGSVPPFGNLLGLKVYLDRRLLENREINFNAARLTHSIRMTAVDLLRVVQPVLGDFAAPATVGEENDDASPTNLSNPASAGAGS